MSLDVTDPMNTSSAISSSLTESNVASSPRAYLSILPNQRFHLDELSVVMICPIGHGTAVDIASGNTKHVSIPSQARHCLRRLIILIRKQSSA